MIAVHLKITSWKGTGIGAEHYYGKLVCWRPGRDVAIEDVRLNRRITSAEAKHLNKKDRAYRFATYRKGDETDRFATPDDVRAMACDVWREHFPEAVLLVEGNFEDVGPHTALDGPQELKDAINALVKRAEACGWWKNRKQMQEICDEWEQLLRAETE